MKISVSKGLTINLGNYESYKFEVRYESDEQEASFDALKQLVDQRVAELAMDAGKYKGKMPKP